MRTIGFPADQLELEITESALMHDMDTASAILDWLNTMAMKLSIDDFGTGFSSLSQLKRLPLDASKMDRLFAMHVNTDEDNAAIVRSVIGTAHHLGLNVVAERVETHEVTDLLTGRGCDLAQGCFISKPLPADELHTWLAGSPWTSGEKTDRATLEQLDEAAV